MAISPIEAKTTPIAMTATSWNEEMPSPVAGMVPLVAVLLTSFLPSALTVVVVTSMLVDAPGSVAVSVGVVGVVGVVGSVGVVGVVGSDGVVGSVGVVGVVGSLGFSSGTTSDA